MKKTPVYDLKEKENKVGLERQIIVEIRWSGISVQLMNNNGPW